MMKTNALLTFFFFFFALFAFTTAAVVSDSDGDLLKNGGKYYLLPPDFGDEAILGNVIEKDVDASSSCSLAVVQKSLNNNGWSTKIESPFHTRYIDSDSPLWISFTHLPLGTTCTKNPQWLVTRELRFGDPVMVGDAKEFYTSFPDGRFYIKPYDTVKFYHFKLVFCYDLDDCGHVVVKTDSHGNNRLVVTQDERVKPLAFKFVKDNSNDVVAAAA